MSIQIPDGMTKLGYKIFLDRYALKDTNRKSWQERSVVLAHVDGQRELVLFSRLENQSVIVELEDGSEMTIPIDQVDLPLELHPRQMWRRVSSKIASVEVGEAMKTKMVSDFEWLLEGWRFVPGGRIMSAAGAPGDLTYYNCFVLPSPHDSREGILKTLGQMTEVMARGGGVGLNLGSLRPRGAYVRGVDGRSSGAVSWGSVYSHVTGLVEQGGTRRGALMLILPDWHPDVLEFIDSKRIAGQITNANISVAISDNFMEAVEKDLMWDLVFPDTSDPKYKTEWDGDLRTWLLSGGSVTVWKTLPAREIWQRLVASSWASAEPGVWFVDTTFRMSNTQHMDIGKLISTNPCGEQPLPAWGVCNLGALNLSKFIIDKKIDWQNLEKAVHLAVRFLDNVVTCTPYVFHENKFQQLHERRVGLGTMGLADMLIQMGIRYGSHASREIVDILFEFIKAHAYKASADLAVEKGSYPDWHQSAMNYGFLNHNLSQMESRFEGITQQIYRHGLRNATILTQAPTGSTATMVNTSTGIEPYFALRWERKGRLGTHEERISALIEWEKNNKKGKKTPDFFVTAHDLEPKDHVHMQAIIQEHVDSAISKTCNVPHDWTIQQVDELYRLMYKLKCKGGTIYRDGSRSEQVLVAEPAAGPSISIGLTPPALVSEEISPSCDIDGNCTTCLTA